MKKNFEYDTGRDTPSAEEVLPADAIELQGIIGLRDDGTHKWKDSALCAQTDPELFYPEKGSSTKEARKVCVSCEVRSECLEEALANNERFGIWGGLSERERRKLKKRESDQ